MAQTGQHPGFGHLLVETIAVVSGAQGGLSGWNLLKIYLELLVAIISPRSPLSPCCFSTSPGRSLSALQSGF